MFKTFRLSFSLRNTYKTNGVIYSLKSIPLIRRILPSSLYASHGLKVFANVISIILEFFSIFTGKLLYVSCMTFLPMYLTAKISQDNFIHILFFLTLIGTYLNTQMFNPTKDKFYAMILMRMDAREYTLSNYFYFIGKMVVGFLPFIPLFGYECGTSLWLCFLMIFFIVAAKVCYAAYVLTDYHKTGKVKNENLPSLVEWGITALLLLCAYIPPYFGYAINSWIFVIACILLIIPVIFAFRYLLHFNYFRSVYKELLTDSPFIQADKSMQEAAQMNAMQKKIDLDTGKTSSKSGYAYFNEIFMKRHNRLLTKSAKRIALIALGVLLAGIAALYFLPASKADINELTLTFLPYFLFVMYLINRGGVITKAMFINCDHSMLTYRFYRQPKAVLTLFASRLKYVVLINLLPAVVIAVGLPLLLYLSGGTDDPLNYFLLFISIISMSVFFSVHHMVLYYLLQPYNIHLEAKNATYAIINSLTYLVCYVAIGKRVPTLIFGSAVSAFCILYIVIACVLAFRLAPKTFKLRQ